MKKNPLVCQHLEMISRKAIDEYQDILKKFVRRRHGIYALYRKNRLRYVGLASNLKSRLSHHLRDRHAKSWDHFSVYLTLKSDHLRELEALAIRIAAPKENRQMGKLRKSQNLKKIFKRSVADRLKHELDDLFYKKADVSDKKLVEVVAGRHPVLAGYFNKGTRIRLWHKGKIHKGFVKKDGTIRYKRKFFTSPTLAARAATRLSVSGWLWWKYERAPGDWVKLDELRK